MHLLMPLASAAALAISYAGAAAAAEKSPCQTEYRPRTNETAYAAVGSPLMVADRHCTENLLVIPFDQQIRAVHMPQGEYRQSSASSQITFFSLRGQQGQQVTSCPVCDPLAAMLVTGEHQERLCVLSKLGITSCAEPGSVSFAVSKHRRTEENVCIPTLIYHGRNASQLRFEYTDCSRRQITPVVYDLSYGSIIRFNRDRFKIVSADNEGVTFQRLPEAKMQSVKSEPQDM